tara:strand:- start:68 stop:697 length:630 start_codon:yes stop_codon:yes gene_type:complete
MEEGKTSGKAIASFILAILSFVIPFLILVAIPLGFVALSQIKKEGLRGKGFAIAGIVIGFVAIAVSLVFFILARNAMNEFVENTEKEWENERIERNNLEESCKEIKFEIVSIGNCPASSTSCEVVVKRLGGEMNPDKTTVIVDDGSNLIGSRLRWDYEGTFNVGETKTITVTNDLEKGKLAEEASTVQVYAYVSDSQRDTGCMTTEKIL